MPTALNAQRVDVVIPVYNEQDDLGPNINTLVAFLRAHCPYRWRVIVADNASTDRTPEVVRELVERCPGEVNSLRLEEKGRGRALKAAWLASDADVVSYMDVDLSTNLQAFSPLIDALLVDGYDISIGTRLAKGAQVTRRWKREVVSRGYNLLIKLLFWNRFSDAQCGFKALSRRAAGELLPLVRDHSWFFDTELLLRAEQRNFRIFEVPVEWIEDLDSRVNLLRTAWEDIRGLIRVRLS